MVSKPCGSGCGSSAYEESHCAHLKIAAIGPATKKAIEKRGVRVDVVPEEYVAESVVKSLRTRGEREAGSAGPREGRARCHSARVTQGGAQVDVFEAYETVVPKSSRTRLRDRTQQNRKLVPTSSPSPAPRRSRIS